MTVRAGTATTAPAPTAEGILVRRHRTLWSDAFRQFRRHRGAMVGLVVFSVLLLAVIFGPLLYPLSAGEIDMTNRLAPPSIAHPMGTDDLGRDLLARVLVGGRISMSVGIAAMIIAVTIGMAVGAIAGAVGGMLDTGMMRVTDLFIALPQLPLLLLVIYLFRDPMRAAIGPEMGTFVLVVVVIGGLRWMSVARLVRAQILSIKQREYIEAARCIGVPGHRMVTSHMIPNSLSPVIVAASLGVAAAILTESTLSFLGLGFPPDMPTWGRLIVDGRDQIDAAAWVIIFPGMMIFLAVLSINFIGDGLRDALDPRKTQ